MSFWERLRSLFDEKLLKFLIVGVINTLVGTAIMFGLYNLLDAYSLADNTTLYWLASAANYVLTSILSFFLNKYFTFRQQGHSWQEVVRFAVTIAVCYFVAYGVAKPLAKWLLVNADENLRDNVAMLVGMCLFTGLNYLGQRLFAFKEPSE